MGNPNALLRAVHQKLPVSPGADTSPGWSCADASLELTRQVAEVIADCALSYPEQAFVLALSGPLGSGKTAFVKSLAGRLGVPEREVLSPTFSYLGVYQDGLMPLYHFDLYRLASKRDFEELGFWDYLSLPGICCLEWAEKIMESRDRSTPRHLQVQLQFVPKHPRKRCIALNVMPRIC